MPDTDVFAAVEAELQRLRETVQRAGEVFGLNPDEDPERPAPRPLPHDAAPDMRRLAATLGIASIALLSI